MTLVLIPPNSEIIIVVLSIVKTPGL